MQDVQKFMGAISGIVGSVMTIGAFILMLFKPIRQKVKDWVAMTAMTPQLTESIKEINKSIEQLGEDLKDIHDELKAHVTSNSEDIKNSNVAQMITLRLKLRDIYLANLAAKTLSAIEQMDIHDIYDTYVALNGNKYVHWMYEEMCTWPTRDGD